MHSAWSFRSGRAAGRPEFEQFRSPDSGPADLHPATMKFKEAVFVLHCFQKKSKRGISTPKQELDLIRARLKIAEAIAWELRHGEAHQ